MPGKVPSRQVAKRSSPKMQSNVALCSLCFMLIGAAASRVGDHPIADVIGMLKELSAQAVAEGKSEEVAFAKFQHWCSSSTKALKKAISEEKEKIEILEATVSAKKKEIATFEEEIAALEEEIAKKEAAMGKLDKEREDGKALYEKTTTDLKATISAVEEAIKIISESRGTNLLQLTPKIRRTLELAEVLAPVEARGDL